MRISLRLIHSLVPLAFLSVAIPGRAQTVAATSCSQSDVQTAITNAARGATVTVPSGACTWNSTLTITKGVHLIGAGSSSVIITNGAGDNDMLDISPDATAVSASENIEVSGFTFNGNGNGNRLIEVNGAGSSGTKPYDYVLIHDNVIENTGSGSGSGNTCIGTAGQVRGVIYKNILDRCDMAFRPMGNDDIPDWENPAYNNLPYGSQDNLYFEDNTIEFTSSYTSSDGYGGWFESGQGGRAVVRFNTWNMTNLTNPSEFWDVHGFQYWTGSSNSGESGTMLVEFYDNTVENVAKGAYRWINARGGHDLFINNTYSGPNTVDIDASSYSGVCPVSPENLDGSGPYTGPSGVLNNTYFINNTENGGVWPAQKNPNGDSNYYTCGIAINVNWWTQTASTFTGATGAGYGTLASRPSSCTAGVGYWATDQGNWNQSGSGGQGELYTCTATNTWTLYYTPYTYPNPLQNSGNSSGPGLPTDLNGNVVVH